MSKWILSGYIILGFLWIGKIITLASIHKPMPKYIFQIRVMTHKGGILLSLIGDIWIKPI